MSKVSFRARALDATKPMPVYRAEEIPDLPDFANINRSVPAMPTGMEKEEETVRFCFWLRGLSDSRHLGFWDSDDLLFALTFYVSFDRLLKQ